MGSSAIDEEREVFASGLDGQTAAWIMAEARLSGREAVDYLEKRIAKATRMAGHPLHPAFIPPGALALLKAEAKEASATRKREAMLAAGRRSLEALVDLEWSAHSRYSRFLLVQRWFEQLAADPEVPQEQLAKAVSCMNQWRTQLATAKWRLRDVYPAADFAFIRAYSAVRDALSPLSAKWTRLHWLVEVMKDDPWAFGNLGLVKEELQRIAAGRESDPDLTRKLEQAANEAAHGVQHGPRDMRYTIAGNDYFGSVWCPQPWRDDYGRIQTGKCSWGTGAERFVADFSALGARFVDQVQETGEIVVRSPHGGPRIVWRVSYGGWEKSHIELQP